jgi:hypothetical protein
MFAYMSIRGLEGYGALVTYVWDPSGILLHLAEPIERKPE